jgi:DNA-binding MarR family transcriptional regulator
MSDQLNKILHQPIRTRIMAYLLAHQKAEYTLIKKQFDLSDGHMTTHMRELLENEYVYAQKDVVDNKIKTTYFITDLGKKAFLDYIQTLKRIIEL